MHSIPLQTLESSMKSDVSNSEIEALERVLNDFKHEWNESQTRRASKWRFSFAICFLIALGLSFYSSSFWWIGLAVITYFAGSLYSMLRQNAKTHGRIIEHQQQLKLVRLLRKFKASPYSEK